MAITVKLTKNKSFLFLLPLLQLKSNSGIINAYIGNISEDSGDLVNHNIYLICETSNYYVEGSKYFQHKVKLEDDSTILYTLRFPEEFSREYQYFLEGKYSKFSEEAKQILCKNACKNTRNKPTDTNMYGVLYKTEEKRKQLEEVLSVKIDKDAELASIIDVNREIYGM